MTNLHRIHPTNSQQTSLARQSWRALPVILVLALAAAGCSNRTPTPTAPAVTTGEKRGDWFCQPAVAGAQDPWECIQDKDLAKNPKPDRLPNADVEPFEPDPQLDGADLPMPDDPPPPPPPGLSQLQGSDPPEPINPSPASRSNTSPQPPPASTTSTKRSRPLPDYIRLAYQPTQPVSILDLPGNYYAVQLAALSREEDIETFVAKHQLNSLSAAKVEINGTVRYVLILGIYDSREKAELAAAGEKPAPLANFTPWIRKLSNLQEAMQTAR